MNFVRLLQDRDRIVVKLLQGLDEAGQRLFVRYLRQHARQVPHQSGIVLKIGCFCNPQHFNLQIKAS